MTRDPKKTHTVVALLAFYLQIPKLFAFITFQSGLWNWVSIMGALYVLVLLCLVFWWRSDRTPALAKALKWLLVVEFFSVGIGVGASVALAPNEMRNALVLFSLIFPWQSPFYTAVLARSGSREM